MAAIATMLDKGETEPGRWALRPLTPLAVEGLGATCVDVLIIYLFYVQYSRCTHIRMSRCRYTMPGANLVLTEHGGWPTGEREMACREGCHRSHWAK